MSKDRTDAIAVIGAGPAGLIAAEALARGGHAVTVFDRMPSPARKFLLAGRGGLNLTHSEPLDRLLERYGPARAALEPAIRTFPPEALRAFASALGEDPFVGSSGRVFPKSFKATPLLRAWLRRIAAAGVTFRFRHAWAGWTGDGALLFRTPEGDRPFGASATLLAMGGASWPRLGSHAAWVDILAERGIGITPLHPANCGLLVQWSDTFRTRFEGAPLKTCAFRIAGQSIRSEAMISRSGIEGGAIYALSAAVRGALAAGPAPLDIDLKPDLTIEALAERLGRPRGRETFSNFLRKKTGLSPVAAGLLREAAGAALPVEPLALARLIKAVRITVTGTSDIDRAISTAGGVGLDEINADFMLEKMPGVFVAGEMLDWEAPTGGYLLQACFSTGAAAAGGIEAFLAKARA
jgi:uncharacterized flavoprotein (TIGR03862 family)